jgi:hypothetical protein
MTGFLYMGQQCNENDGGVKNEKGERTKRSPPKKGAANGLTKDRLNYTATSLAECSFLTAL